MISPRVNTYLQIAGLLLGPILTVGCAKDSLLSSFAPTGLPKMTEPEIEESDADDMDSRQVAENDSEE